MPNASCVLLADDDPDYALLVKIAFEHAGIPDPVRIVSDGFEAIRYLKGEGPYADRGSHPLPTLVLLDVRLPRLSGFDVLRWIRRQKTLDGMFVAIFTGSEIESEARLARELGANSYLVKPFNFHLLVDMLSHLRDSWHQGDAPKPMGKK